jgi:DNA-binding transcriptional ArsR family regulator
MRGRRRRDRARCHQRLRAPATRRSTASCCCRATGSALADGRSARRRRGADHRGRRGVPRPAARGAVAGAAEAVQGAGDEGRLKLLRRLSSGPISLSEATAELDVAKATAHHHLSILRQAGLVVDRWRGRGSRATALREDPAEAAADLLAAYLQPHRTAPQRELTHRAPTRSEHLQPDRGATRCRTPERTATPTTTRPAPRPRRSRPTTATLRPRLRPAGPHQRLPAAPGQDRCGRPGEADFFRTRLTHTIEVAQLARRLGWKLGAHPDLVEAAAIMHDFGHAPFGHVGEEELSAAVDDTAGRGGSTRPRRRVRGQRPDLPARRRPAVRLGTRAGPEPDPCHPGRRDQVPLGARRGERPASGASTPPSASSRPGSARGSPRSVATPELRDPGDGVGGRRRLRRPRPRGLLPRRLAPAGAADPVRRGAERVATQLVARRRGAGASSPRPPSDDPARYTGAELATAFEELFTEPDAPSRGSAPSRASSTAPRVPPGPAD